MSCEEVRRAFELSPLLRGLDADAFDVTVCGFPAGRQPKDEASGRPSAGLVVSGQVDVWSVAPDGSSALLNVLMPGDCFGISNLLDPEPLITSLRCACACTIAYIPKEQFEEALRTDSRFALRYAAVCNQKLRFLLRRIALLTAQSSRGRLLSYLLYHMDGSGTVSCAGSRDDLAASLSMSRATLYRELQALRKDGILSFSHRTLSVTDPEALERALLNRAPGATDAANNTEVTDL